MVPQTTSRTTRALATFAALHAVFTDIHPLCDQILQSSEDAIGKGEPGLSGSRHCARHVASYSAGQGAASLLVTRALGYRIPVGPFLAGLAINAVTHYVIDRRTPFIRFLRSTWVGKAGYLDHATVQRRDGIVDNAGPGTALMECDQAAHRAIGVLASAVTTCLAMRRGDGRR